MPARPGTCYDVISGCQSQQRRTADALIRPVIKSARLRFAPAVTLMTARCQPVTDRGTASISTRQTARANCIGNESVPIQLAQCWFPGLAIYNGRFQIKYTEAMLSSEMASSGNQHCANCFGTLSWPIHVLEREVEGQLVQKLERNKRTHGWTNTTDRITFLAYALCITYLQVDVFPVKGSGRLGSRVVSVLDSGAEGPGFKSQSRRSRITVLGKLFTPIVPLFTKQRNW